MANAGGLWRLPLNKGDPRMAVRPLSRAGQGCQRCTRPREGEDRRRLSQATWPHPACSRGILHVGLADPRCATCKRRIRKAHGSLREKDCGWNYSVRPPHYWPSCDCDRVVSPMWEEEPRHLLQEQPCVCVFVKEKQPWKACSPQGKVWRHG